MTATLTVNRQCSRCPRIEREEVSLEEAAQLLDTGLSGPKALRVVKDGVEVVELENLCGTCDGIVQNYLELIGKQLQNRSSRREAVEVEIEA